MDRMLCYGRPVVWLWVALVGVFYGCDSRKAAPESVEIELTYTCAYDSTEQKAMAYIPGQCVDSLSPLLVVTHYLGGSRHTARRQGYYPVCDSLGWLVVCPEMHGRRTGGKTAFASLESQHDVMCAIAWMKRNYRIDSSRIYLAGRSMGGMMAQTMAAKYADVFAAAVSGQGISDLEQWIEQSPRFRADVEKECGPMGDSTRFEYARRSSVNYACNLRYVPLILWHGTVDRWVPPSQSRRLRDAIAEHVSYPVTVNWLAGAPHCADNYTPRWICEQLQYHQNVPEAGVGLGTRFFRELELVTDENKAFFWVHLYRRSTNDFGRITAKLRDDTVMVQARNLQQVDIRLDQIAEGMEPSRIEVVADGDLELVVTDSDSLRIQTTIQKQGAMDLPKAGS